MDNSTMRFAKLISQLTPEEVAKVTFYCKHLLDAQETGKPPLSNAEISRLYEEERAQSNNNQERI
jgi:hypothetical protein